MPHGDEEFDVTTLEKGHLRKIAEIGQTLHDSEVLGQFENLFLTPEQAKEAGLNDKSRLKIFGFSPLKAFKKGGKKGAKPIGPFAGFSTEDLVNEMLAREGGKPGTPGFTDISTSDIFGELRLRDTANAPEAPGTRTDAQTLAATKGVLATENANANRDAAGLITLGSRGLIDTPADPGNIGTGGRRTGSARFLASSRNQSSVPSTLVTQNNAIANAGGVNANTLGNDQVAGTTTPEGEALRRRNSSPIRLGSAPKDSGSVLGRASSSILARR